MKTSVNDTTEASAGWYWQFNRMQGYKLDGFIIVPPSGLEDTIIEDHDWQAQNDPCALELGSGWRLPTATEWFNVDASGPWTNWLGPWNSPLKLHAAGQLEGAAKHTPGLDGRGYHASYWSSSQSDPGNGWFLWFDSSQSKMDIASKSNGCTIRCLRE